LGEQKFGIGQGFLVGIEYIGIKEILPVQMDDLPDVPGKNPAVEERIAGIPDSVAQVEKEGIGQQQGQGKEKKEDQHRL
jgi:hypothetical protein